MEARAMVEAASAVAGLYRLGGAAALAELLKGPAVALNLVRGGVALVVRIGCGGFGGCPKAGY